MRVLPDEFPPMAWPSVMPRGPASSNTASRTTKIAPICDRHTKPVLTAEQCRSALDRLTPRQRDVLAAMVAGNSNKQIAHLLSLSPRTVEVYRASMMSRLHVRTLAQTLYIAFMAGLTPCDPMSLG
ncbi:response regulator transcription factor [Sphingomonas hylomeconis]|uniref:Response regulator transcription factor n=1 Tax=Sphingomonas hylomeconis TaxID=1395958 RepID=A0ABV7SQM9_9SPHN